MGSACSRHKEITDVNKVENFSNDKTNSNQTLYNDSNSSLLAVQFENERSIVVLKYRGTKDAWTLCHTIPVKGLYRTTIVKNFLLFHDWEHGVRVCCYDITTRAIRTIKPLKESQPYWSCYCAAEFQDQLYLIGADVEDDRRVYSWDPTTDVLSTVPKLKMGRTRATALKHAGYLYVVGGQVGSITNYRDTNAVERFNSRRNQWEQCASLLQARGVPALASAGEYIYAIGGDCADIPTNMVERYDTRINKWTHITVMQVPKVFAATAYFNNRLVVCGNASNSEDCSVVEEYDEAANKWRRKSKMPMPGPFSFVLATPEWTTQLESLN